MYQGQIITDNNITWKVKNISPKGTALSPSNESLYEIMSTLPRYYYRDELFIPNKTTIKTPGTLLVQINNSGYVISGSQTINLADSVNWCSDSTAYVTPANRAGKDFYIYAVENESTEESMYLLSVNSTVPGGYTAANSRKIGGFHCLCADVGTISDHTLSDYVTGDILPLSIWDLEHRPISDPEGMVWVAPVNKWVDIYLNSWNGSKLVSKYGADIADGGTTVKWHGEKFEEYLGFVNKTLPFRSDFIVFAKGSNECTNVVGSTDKGVTGGYTDTEGRRMISNYGLEMCCGHHWQWTRDLFENYATNPVTNTVRNSNNSGTTTVTTYPNAYWNSSRYYFDGYGWQEIPVYNSSVDSQKYGSSVGLLRRGFVGGDWSVAAYCGSRCVNCSDFPSFVHTAVGARGASEPKKCK